jgi:hypothetical protein
MKKALIFIGACIFLTSVSIFIVRGGVVRSINNPSCEEIFGRVNDDSFKSDVLVWADQNIIGRVFPSANFTIGHYSGPGMRTATLKMSRAKVDIPSWFSGSEIRILGDRKKPAELIYIAMGRYRGLLIGKNDLLHYSTKDLFKLDSVKHDGRIGALCYEDR